MTTEKLLHKVDAKSRIIKRQPKGLFKALPHEIIDNVVGQLDFKEKMKFRTASMQTKAIVDRQQFIEFKRYQHDDPELLQTVVHFVENGFSPPVLHSIINVHQRLMQFMSPHPKATLLCYRLIALNTRFYKQAKRHFTWASFKLLSTVTAMEMLLITTNQQFTIVSEKPTSLKLQLLTLHNHDKGRLVKCSGDIVKFISELSVINMSRYGETPQKIFLSVNSTPKVVQAFKAFLLNGKFKADTSDYIEATFCFPEGETTGSFSFRI